MSLTIWHISKYVVPRHAASVGARGFLLLREMARMGHTCVMFTSDSNHLATPPHLEGPSLEEISEDVHVCWIRTRKYNGAKSFGRILSWLDFEWRLRRLPKGNFPKPDVLIVSSLSLLTIMNGLLLRRKYGCQLVFEIRDIWPMVLTEVGGFSPYNPLIIALGWLERVGYRRADLVVGTMPNLKEHVEAVLDAPRDVHCIPMGVDKTLLEAAQPLDDDFRHRYIPKNKFIICHAGSIGIDNALDTLMTCARSLRHNPDIHFLIVGKGDLKDRYERECADLPNITFAPAVPKAAVQSVLACCDVLYFAAHTSKVLKYGQSLNKVTDYMLAARPILASYSGYPSMIDESGCGSFVPAGDVNALQGAILEYHALPLSERQRMGQAGRDWLLKNRSYRRLAQDYLALFKDPDQAVDQRDDHLS